MWTIYTSQDGRVFRGEGIEVPQRLDKDGYPRVTMYLGNSKYKVRHVHRLVAEEHLPNPNNLPHVNHIDGNKLNNHVHNLEWCTVRHNTMHALKKGLRTFTPRDASKGPRDNKGRFVSGS